MYIYIYTLYSIIIHICHIIAIVLTYMYLHKLPSVSKCRKKLCLDGDGICPASNAHFHRGWVSTELRYCFPQVISHKSPIQTVGHTPLKFPSIAGILYEK